MSVTQQIEHVLSTHHAYLREHMGPLSHDLRAARAPRSVLEPWETLADVLEDHLWKEENILFPGALRLESGGGGLGCGFEGPITQMRHEHTLIEDLMGTLRAHLGEAGELGPRLAHLLDDLEAHAHLEDDTLFPAILALGGED